ncbi:hypothetical protein [Parapedobacter koreensis]|uniref:Uncharacterized protein n=1 Tax=Parapedobacter koreensis TaxID=332977 RepID=A0A1H7Q2J4_9SPHI|nr:hypothetical protein [Parapedobacter koreensis]SEL41695.1 hypothetical protein SAMN05421740_105119 [Parapedobacter koreensis]
MAQQASFIKFKGKIGDLSFYQNRSGYQARTKGGVSASRIATDPNYARTRENMAEFGRAGSASKQLRNALRALLVQYSDRNVSGRLSSRLLRVLKTDPANRRGERTVAEGNLHLLRGFEFNEGSSMSNTLFEDVVFTVDRASGAVTATTQPWTDPRVAMAVPPEATHYRLTLAAVAADFGGEGTVVVRSQTEQLDLQATPAQELEASLPAETDLPILVLLGVGFFQQVNGEGYALQNGAFNALSIMEVHTT